MLNDLDHYIKEQLHIKLYIRYMDDLILIHHNKAYLEGCRDKIIKELGEIGFEANPKKTRIYHLSDGIMFLGFRFRLSDTGKVIMIADPKRVKAGRKKYRRLVTKAIKTGMPRESVDQSFETWINHLGKGNSYNLINRLRKYYNDLWRCNDGHCAEEIHPG